MISFSTDRPRRTGALLRTALLAGLLGLVASVSPVLAAPGGQSSLAAVRAATAAYHDLATAEAANYGLFPGCFSHPLPDGGMGVHYVRFDQLDGSIDPLAPEGLVYEPQRGGGLRLVAVEYIVPVAAWTGEDPPELFGQTFSYEGAGNEFGIFPFYELHVWLWQPNPNGMFYEWNPRVTCNYYAG
jgi:hypothetical protein